MRQPCITACIIIIINQKAGKAIEVLGKMVMIVVYYFVNPINKL